MQVFQRLDAYKSPLLIPSVTIQLNSESDERLTFTQHPCVAPCGCGYAPCAAAGYCVSTLMRAGGWDGVFALKREKPKARKTLEKGARTHLSTTGCVSPFNLLAFMFR